MSVSIICYNHYRRSGAAALPVSGRGCRACGLGLRSVSYLGAAGAAVRSI